MPKNKSVLPVKVTVIKRKTKPITQIKSTRQRPQKDVLDVFVDGFDFLSAYSKLLIKNLIIKGENSKFHAKSQMAKMQNRPIVLTHLTPKLTAKQKEERKREIESQLFEVFRKYQK